MLNGERINFIDREGGHTLTIMPKEEDALSMWLDQYNYTVGDLDTVFVPKAGDLVSLREAFLLGENPNDPDDALSIDLQSTASEGFDLRFGALVGRSYQLQGSEDLLNWSDMGPPVVVGDSKQVIIPMDTGGADKAFFRLLTSFAK